MLILRAVLVLCAICSLSIADSNPYQCYTQMCSQKESKWTCREKETLVVSCSELSPYCYEETQNEKLFKGCQNFEQMEDSHYAEIEKTGKARYHYMMPNNRNITGVYCGGKLCNTEYELPKEYAVDPELW